MLIKRLLKYVYMFLKKKQLKFRKCMFEAKTEFNPFCKFEGNNLVGYGTYLADIHLGFASYISSRCFIKDAYIGKYTCIGPDVKIVIGRHPTSRFVSIHPAFYSNNHAIPLKYVKNNKFVEIKKVYVADEDYQYSVYIGNDVWIGADVTIMDGVTIGDGAIIGAGAIVMENVAPYSIMVGTPARFLKKRFENDEIDFLLKFKWWDKDVNWLEKYAEFFEDIKKFRNICETKIR